MSDKKPKNIGRMARNKGAGGERELAKELERLLNCEAHRGRQFSGSPESPDVKTTIDGVHWECKRTEALSLYPAVEQAKWDSGEGNIGVVAHRRNNRKWLFICELDDLPTVVMRLYLGMVDRS